MPENKTSEETTSAAAKKPTYGPGLIVFLMGSLMLTGGVFLLRALDASMPFAWLVALACVAVVGFGTGLMYMGICESHRGNLREHRKLGRKGE